jgi:hypothetical protein
VVVGVLTKVLGQAPEFARRAKLAWRRLEVRVVDGRIAEPASE